MSDQEEYWNEHGNTWVVWQERLDRQIAPHGQLALDALAVKPDEAILDVGCGCGDTLLALAERVGVGGRVVGLDVSAPMLERARERVANAGADQVTIQQGDAAKASLTAESFDALFSRFGVMFFEEPIEAFSNFHRALRPGGRMAFVCWRGPQDNPWITVPMAAVAPLLEFPPPPPPGSPGMLALADEERLRGILAEAGFTEIKLQPEDIAMAPGGGTLDGAVEVFMEVGPVASVLRNSGADDATRQRVEDAVRQAFAAEGGDEQLELGSGCWLVTARRA
ncbi:MAG: class I SAM-dependent methyltransferase [bacterium]|nr:class I SAM-dependent methyltransferase [bacterium]MCP5065180.1 class I SAM-dependent methyltransferase [bacterium]